jgi:hypothetical protein
MPRASKNGSIGALCFALAIIAVFGSAQTSRTQTNSASRDSVHPPDGAELKARGLELIANQHKNDAILDQYERVEHEVDMTGGTRPRTLDDKEIRLVPNGAGVTKLLVQEDGHAVSAEQYRAELQNWLNVLEFMVNPNDDRMKTATAKYLNKKQTRSHLVDSLLTAFQPKWSGRETIDGHDCDVIELTPDPGFHPRSILEDALPHAKAKIWVDHQADQLVRARAEITSDVSVGGGILGKLYKGGVFSMEQAQVAPGVWLPSRFQFDFSGRKFLFSFEEHESVESSRYRYVGSAKDALAQARSELAKAGLIAGDP